MSLLLVMNNSTCVYSCLLSVMNVVMVLENNPNDILPYRRRFPQMPQIEIQGLLNDFEGQSSRKLKDRFWNGLYKQF